VSELSETQAIHRYGAFLSYSHAVDGKLAPAIQNGLHRFAAPLLQLRATRVFRDKASLSANPGLWSAIKEALAQSEYFILLASPEAARSEWVGREIDYWCRHKPIDQMLLVVTDGEIAWEDSAADFDWNKTTALPDRLSKMFKEEPRWLDLRWARTDTDVSLNNLRFRDCVADLSSPLRGQPKDELIGEDVRQNRRTRLLVRSAIGSLATLLLLVSIAAFTVFQQRQEVKTQRDQALRNESLALSNLSRQRTEKGDRKQGIHFALEALPADMNAPNRPYVPDAEAALYTAVTTMDVARRVAALEGHEDNVTNAAFSPDGRSIVTSSYDGTARIWDARTGSQIQVLRGHEGALWHAEFSPNGVQVLTTSTDKTARIWEVESGKELAILQGHQDAVLDAAFGPAGYRVVTASVDATARLWDAGTGEQLDIFIGHEEAICCIDFSPDGKSVVTASNWDGTARLWDIETGEAVAVFTDLPRRMSIPAENSVLAAFSPDGRTIITSATDNTVRLWKAKDGTPTFPQAQMILKGHVGLVNHAAFSSDGRLIITGSADNTARVWEIRNGTELSVLRMPGLLSGEFQTGVHTVAFAPYRANVITAGGSGARLWDGITGESLALLREDHLSSRPSDFAAFSSDGHRVITLSVGHHFPPTIWEIGARSEMHVLKHGPAGLHVYRLAVDPEGKYIATVSYDGSIALWSADTGIHITNLNIEENRIAHMAFSPDGKRLLTVFYHGSTKLWEVPNGRPLTLIKGHNDAVLYATFSSDGRRIATASKDGTARLWTSNGAEITVLQGHEGAVNWAEFSPDGARVVTASDDGTARVWDVASGREITVLTGHTGPVWIARFDPTGKHIATAGVRDDCHGDCGNTIQNPSLWDAGTGELLTELRGHTGTVRHLAFSPDGSNLITGQFGGTVRMWQISDGSLLRTFDRQCMGTLGDLKLATFSLDGHRVITVTGNGRVNLWDGETGTRLTTLHSYPVTRTLPECYFQVPEPSPLAKVAAISHNNRILAVAGDNGTVRVLRLFPTTQDLIDHALEQAVSNVPDGY